MLGAYFLLEGCDLSLLPFLICCFIWIDLSSSLRLIPERIHLMICLLPFLISCLIWLDLVVSLPLIEERIIVIIVLLHFLSLMLGSGLGLMLPLLVWLTPDLRIKNIFFKFNRPTRKTSLLPNTTLYK